jgi:Protein of unknown function (DUF541)
MKDRALSPRQVIAVAVSAAVLLLAFWAGGASAAPKGAPKAPSGLPGTPLRDDAVVASPPSIGMPSIGICCPGSGSTGLTASGEGSVQGQGTNARDEAIAKAIADATDQAKAAAKAAGITLGPIVSMQVSASGYAYPYPVMEQGGAATGVAGKAVGANTTTGVIAPIATGVEPDAGSTSPGAPGAPGVPGPVQTYASVTVTWSIA